MLLLPLTPPPTYLKIKKIKGPKVDSRSSRSSSHSSSHSSSPQPALRALQAGGRRSIARSDESGLSTARARLGAARARLGAVRARLGAVSARLGRVKRNPFKNQIKNL